MASHEDLLFHLEIPGGAGEQAVSQRRLSGHSSRSHVDFQVQEPTPVTLGKVRKDDFEILHLIGQGGYGKVWQVKYKTTNEIYAMKVFRKDFLVKSKAVSSTFVERDVLKKCLHPNIVRLHFAFQDEDRLYLVMDYINGGQLFNVLRDGDSVADEKLARFYMAELVLALEYLHDNNIVHRDLKPENILIDEDGHILLTDFGLAKEDISNENRTSSFCGTLEYMSPEMIQGQPYSFSTDMWSIGVLLYDILMGRPPFMHSNNSVLQKKIMTEKIKLPSYLDASTHAVIKGLIERNVERRLTIKKLKSHAFFKGVDWEKLQNHEVQPPFRPKVTRGMSDVSNFDEKFTSLPAQFSPVVRRKEASDDDVFANFSYTRPMTPPIRRALELSQERSLESTVSDSPE